MVTLKNKDGSLFICKCGNSNFKMGYESVACTKCGSWLDYNSSKGLQAPNLRSLRYVGLISKKEYERRDALIKEFKALDFNELPVHEFRRDESVECPQCGGNTETEKVKRRNVHKCRNCDHIFIVTNF